MESTLFFMGFRSRGDGVEEDNSHETNNISEVPEWMSIKNQIDLFFKQLWEMKC